MPTQIPTFGILNCGDCTFGGKLGTVNSIPSPFSDYTLVAKYLSLR